MRTRRPFKRWTSAATSALPILVIAVMTATAAPQPHPVTGDTPRHLPAAAAASQKLPDWFEQSRVQAHTRYAPFVWWGRPEFDDVASRLKDLGARAFTRHIKQKDEDPFWPSAVPTGPDGERLFDGDRINRQTINVDSGVRERFVPAGTDLAADIVTEAEREGMSVTLYNTYEFDLRIAESHPEWLCRDVNGDLNTRTYGGNFGVPLDITIPVYQEIVGQRLLELAERGAKGLYFDRLLSPFGGCFSQAAVADYEASTGNSAPTPDQYPSIPDIPHDIDCVGGETDPEECDLENWPFPRLIADHYHPAYLDWAEYRIGKIEETLEYWRDTVKAQYPEVVFVVSVTELPGLTGVLGSTRWARVADSVKSEYTNGIRFFLRNFIFDLNPDLARPDDDVSQALGFTVMRDSSNGRPPHNWSGVSLPNTDHALAWAASLLTYGNIANLDVWERFDTDDPHGPRPFTPLDAMRATHDLGRRVSPLLANTRPVRWAAVHFSESQRNARYVLDEGVKLAWQEVLWPLTGAFDVLVEEGVPVGTVDDQQLANGELDGYRVLFLAHRDELTADQAAAVARFERTGGVVIENDPRWDWADPDQTAAAKEAFRVELAPLLPDSPVRVTGGSDNLHAGVFALPSTGRRPTDRLVISISNDFSFVQNPSQALEPEQINPPPPPAQGVQVTWGPSIAYPAGPSGRPARVFDAVTGQTFQPELTPDGYTVTLPEFDHLAMLVIERVDPTAIDGAAPWLFGAAVEPNPTFVGNPVELVAVADDHGDGRSAIASASYNIDGGDLVPMQAAGGAFDSPFEELVATVPPFDVPGEHTLCVTATDVAGNTSGLDCTQLLVMTP